MYINSKAMKNSNNLNMRPGKYKFNGVTYYVRNGKLCAMPSKRGPSETPPTGEQSEFRDAFSTMTGFTTNFFSRDRILVQSWALYSQQFQKTYLDSFKRINYPTLDPELNGVDYFPDFSFSEGYLVALREIRVTREDWTFHIYWDVPRRKFQRCAPDNELVLGFFYDSHPDAPQILQTPYTREDKYAIIEIPDNGFLPSEDVHLYPFFAANDWQAFSRSKHVLCEGERGETGDTNQR